MRVDQIVQQAVTLQRQGRLQEAVQLYQQALQAAPERVDVLHLMAVALLQGGQAHHAMPLLERAIALKPNFADAHASHGAALRRLGRPGDALASFNRAIECDRQHVEGHVGYATALFELGRHAEALSAFDAALKLAPKHASAHSNRGAVLQVMQRSAEALQAFDRALVIAPQMAEAHANRANALRELGRHAEALAACERALALRPGYSAALRYRGFALLELDQAQEALASFEAALQGNAADLRALTGRGRALAALGRQDLALAAYDAALTRFEGDAHTHFHKAVALYDLQRFEDALQSINRVLALDPGVQGAHHRRADILTKLGRGAEALRDFRREYELHPGSDYALGHYLQAALTAAEWRDYDQLVDALEKRTLAGEEAATPFVLSLVSDSGSLMRMSSEAHARHYKPIASVTGAVRGSGGDKIRIGYFSSDFTDHPVAHLISGVLAAHDRARFEVIAYALGERRDAYTELVRSRVDRLVECKGLSTQQITGQARNDGLDVAVDLNGYTIGAQTRIFSTRVAPVQLSYVGFLGTLGAPFMDYLVADRLVAPEHNRAHFTERLLTLPWYQCNDVDEAALMDAPGRAHYGLPAGGFIFVSFNNVFKLTPTMFAVWMRILARTPGSVLWLFAAEPAARENLAREAVANGIDANRIVFAAGVPRAEHLARQRLADLMLDTFPYNGGATTSNALRAGLPVLTRCGEAFASRMGASLLVAANAPELIAESAEEYEEKAVQFALNKAQASAVAQQIAKAHMTKLYDPVAFARHLERGLAHAVERARAGLPPKDITIS